MSEVVGVHFKRASKVYYFNAAGFQLAPGDYVVVETSVGLELGRVVISLWQVPARDITEPLKPVLRKAELQDLAQAQQLEEKSKEALTKSKELAAKLNLPLKPLLAHYNLDGTYLVVFFTAEQKVDFRELARELSHNLKVKVDLRRLGARDKTKLVGDIGRCGRTLCCASFLVEFVPISIKMAKEQDLSLDPIKISGVCGRFLCCLSYESEQYRLLKEKLPKKGQSVFTPLGRARVCGGNPLKETVLVELENEVTVELPLSEVRNE